MKDMPNKHLECHRDRVGPRKSDETYGNNGLFLLPSGEGVMLSVVASDGLGWDHVSVSLPDRCPTWEEMEYVRKLFFRGDEWVMQLHAPTEKNINFHPHCLHLWRPQQAAIPIPPSTMV
jgi:hypothetical protein